MQPDPTRDRVAEWEAVPRCLLVAYGLLCGCAIVPAVLAGGWLLAGEPRWTWWAYGAVVLPVAVLGAGRAAFPLLAAVVVRWPVLGHRTDRRAGSDGAA